MTKFNVSVGISAYNEETNIGLLITDILKQKGNNFNLKEIIIILDGCRDRTLQKIQAVSDDRILVYDEKTRLGKTRRLNQLFKIFAGDILILPDADIRIPDQDVFSHIVYSFRIHPKLGIAAPDSRPFPNRSFISKCINTSIKAYVRYTKSINNGNNIYACKGTLMALPKSYAEKITIPGNVYAYDTYLYFHALQKGYTFASVPRATVWYKLPTTLTDHIRQNTRFIAAEDNIRTEFGDLVDREFNKNNLLFYRALFLEFIREPFYSLAIILINFYVRFRARLFPPKISTKWVIAKSTK